MSRKIARTFFSTTKRKLLIALPLLAFMTFSCNDNGKDNDPETPKPDNAAIVGKWQKYQRVEDDGTLSSGDPDEFWLFEKDNSFQIEDGGEITDAGTYAIEGKTLIINVYNIDEPTEREELRGFYEIKDGYMNYQYTVVGENDYREYRFRKIQ